MNAKIKMVLFDLDGTIADTLPLCIRAFKAAIEPLADKTFSEKEIMATFGPSEEGTIRALVREDLRDRALAAYYDQYVALHDMVSACFPGIMDLLAWLHNNGILVTMVTGKGRKSALLTLEKLGIRDYFAAIETGSPDGPNKVKGIKHLLEIYHIAPAEAIYIGDATSDILAAHENGVKIVAAAWAKTSDKEALAAAHPDWLLDAVAGLQLFFKALLSDNLSHGLLNILKQINAISDIGLVYSKDEYNIERYSELKALSVSAIAALSGNDLSTIKDFYLPAADYPTPKVDLRAFIVNEDKEILLVQEKADGCWTLPGGWADVGLTPVESVLKEIREEIGRAAKVERLLAVFDKKKHPHPPQPFYVYKMVFLCSLTYPDEAFQTAFDTLDVRYFPLKSLPPLSKDRILESQIELLFACLSAPDHAPLID